MDRIVYREPVDYMHVGGKNFSNSNSLPFNKRIHWKKKWHWEIQKYEVTYVISIFLENLYHNKSLSSAYISYGSKL